MAEKSEIEERIEALRVWVVGRIDWLDARIASLESDDEAAREMLKRLDEAVKAKQIEMPAWLTMTTKVDQLAERLDALEKQKGADEGSVNRDLALSGRLVGLDGRIDALEARFDERFTSIRTAADFRQQSSGNVGPVDPNIFEKTMEHTVPPRAFKELSDEALLHDACEMLDGVLYDAAGTIKYTGGPDAGQTRPTQEAKILADKFKAIRDKTIATAVRVAVPYQPDPMPRRNARPVRRIIEKDAPTIVCLCGSTRFSEAFARANLEETLAGKIVLTVGSMTHSDSDIQLCVRCMHIYGTPGSADICPKAQLDGYRYGNTHRWEPLSDPKHAETKKALDELHKKKIEMADEILVLNVIHCAKCHGMRGDEKVRGADGCAHDMQPYIGESTRGEIEHALKLGKPMRFLNPQGPESTTELSVSGQPYGYGDILTMMHRLGLRRSLA